jgi:RHS repeat-associated protein
MATLSIFSLLLRDWSRLQYPVQRRPPRRHRPAHRDVRRQRDFGLGLYFYNARFYDSYLNRWIQPDSIIPNPGNVLDWDRYAAMRNNPLKYTNPSGHEICNADGWCGEYDPYHDIQLLSQMYGLVFAGKWSASDAITVLRAAIVIGSRMAQAVGLTLSFSTPSPPLMNALTVNLSVIAGGIWEIGLLTQEALI